MLLERVDGMAGLPSEDVAVAGVKPGRGKAGVEGGNCGAAVAEAEYLSGPPSSGVVLAVEVAMEATTR